MSLTWNDLRYFAPYISLFPTIATPFYPPMSFVKTMTIRDLVALWLRLSAPSAGGLDSSPGQGTRSCMPNLKKKTRKIKKPPLLSALQPRYPCETEI